ncbi:recombinase family protein [Persicobacter psychrovividus]|uniref:Resolvase/invertase-type recombinase catalytic domain-containing protein n=1 Tax=Persicobacter psychrovividus TaxID=387638 RepID=A0ABN6LH24_9BACT|nr:hypothetical protein PEPS_46570 [Persicobacter psychrovividus]
MKSIIYSRVSTKEQSTTRQVQELKSVPSFEVEKVFHEKISGFTKTAAERPALGRALAYLKAHSEINCLMVHEISRLGRNTLDVLSLIEQLRLEGIKIYIHNLGLTINTGDAKEEAFSKLIITLMADLARLESEQMSYRIKSGIRARKEKGLHTGRKVGSKESDEKFLSKHTDIVKYLKKGFSYREIQRLCKCSPNTVQKVVGLMKNE